MAKFKFVEISKNKKIRYLFNSSACDIYVVFLHGFKSDLEGEKPKALYRFCKKNNIGFLALEYSGQENHMENSRRVQSQVGHRM